MPDLPYFLAATATAAGITWTLRGAPFAMLSKLRESALLIYLGERVPVGIMLILAFYTLRDTDPTSANSAIPVALALAVTAGLHLWKSNMTLSIFAGTAVYMTLASSLPALG